MLALPACTGSEEERAPTLLVVGLVENNEPQVALISTELNGDYSFLEESRQELPAVAQDFSVTGRRGERGELVVLSRAEDDDNESYLDFFALRGIDPSNPVNFRPVANKPRLVLSTFEDADGSFCGESLQVSSTGRYASIYNGTTCDGVDEPTIDVLDLQEERVLERITGGTFGLVRATPYIDQQSDTLYYMTEGVNEVSLIRLNLSNLNQDIFTTFNTENENDLTNYAADISRQDNNLLILRPAEILAVPLGAPATPITLATSSNSKRFIDNLTTSTDILTLTTSTLTVHRSLQDETEGTAQLNATAGTLEAAEGFAYFPVEGGVTRFDLLRYQRSSVEVSSLLRTFSVTELTKPGPIVYLKGILPETPTP